MPKISGRSHFLQWGISDWDSSLQHFPVRSAILSGYHACLRFYQSDSVLGMTMQEPTSYHLRHLQHRGPPDQSSDVSVLDFTEWAASLLSWSFASVPSIQFQICLPEVYSIILLCMHFSPVVPSIQFRLPF